MQIALDEAAAKLLWNGLAAESRRNYDRAVRQYEEICRLHSLEPWPASIQSIAKWMGIRATGSTRDWRQLKHTTIQSHLSAFKSHCTERRIEWGILDSDIIQRMVKGAAQLFPSSREEKLPITRQILDHIITPFADTRSISEANLNAAFTLAHGGFLRMGEFTVDPKDTQATIATRKLTRGDVLIAEDESYVQVRLKASKSAGIARGSQSTLPQLRPTAPYDASGVCWNSTLPRRQLNLSSALRQDHSSKQAVKVLSRASNLASVAPASTAPNIPVIPFVREQHKTPMTMASLNTTFKSSVAGSLMRLTDIISSVPNAFSHLASNINAAKSQI
jgi:hypothetical protein